MIQPGHDILINSIIRDFLNVMKPDPILKVSEWAERYRHLPAEGEKGGPWRNEVTPYLVEIMDALLEPDIHTVVVMTCSQIGKSEALNNVLFFHADQKPIPQLMIQPTLSDAEDYSKARISPSIAESSRLREIFGEDEGKSRRSGNTILNKVYPGGRLLIMGANSPSALRGRIIGGVTADEISTYETTKEGDPLELAFKRTSTFPNPWFFLTSTPGIKGLCHIERWFDISDKRNYFIPCEACGGEITLRWKSEDGTYLVVWDKDKNGNPLPETAMYICDLCGETLNDYQLNRMVKKGHWKKTAKSNGIAGFGAFPELYSPFRKLEDTVRDFLRVKGDSELLRVWVNQALGQTWEEENEKLSTNDIYDRREVYDLTIPMDAAVLTASIDVQKDRLEVLVDAWGRDERNWSIEHVVFEGNPSIPYKHLEQGQMFDKEAPGVWNQLDEFLKRTYEHQSGAQLGISCTVIDTGYKTDEVYSFVKPREFRGIWAIKGASQRGRQIVSRPSRRNKGKVTLYTIGVFAAKDVVMARLFVTSKSQRGYMHFPDRFPFEFFEQLTAEKKVTQRRRGQFVTEWIKLRERNEAFDLKVYNLAALRIAYPDRSMLNAMADRLANRKKGDEVPEKPAREIIKDKRSIKRVRKKKWMSGV